MCSHPHPCHILLMSRFAAFSALGCKSHVRLVALHYFVGICEHTTHMCCVPLQVYQRSSMNPVAAIPNLIYPDSMPAKNPVAGKRLGTAAMHCDWRSVSAPRASDSLSLPTATDESTAASHSQTQPPDVQATPQRPKRYIVCPDPPTKRLPAKSFPCRPVAANSDCQSLVTQAALPKQDSPKDRVACDMSKLISTAQPSRSAQELLGRLKQISGTAAVSLEASVSTITKVRVLPHQVGVGDGAVQVCATPSTSIGDSTAVPLLQHSGLVLLQGLASRASPRCDLVQDPQSKRMKSDPRFPVAATAEVYQPALMNSYSPREALEAVRADGPLGPVVKSIGAHSDFAFQPLPLQLSPEAHAPLAKSSGKLCISDSAPEPMLAFTQGNAHAFKLPIATWWLLLMHGVMHGVTFRWSSPEPHVLCGFAIVRHASVCYFRIKVAHKTHTVAIWHELLSSLMQSSLPSLDTSHQSTCCAC